MYIYIVLIKVVINLMLGGKKFIKIPTIGVVFHAWLGPYSSQLSTAALLSYIQNILIVFSTVVHSIQVFGSLQAGSLGLGHCKRDSDWYF